MPVTSQWTNGPLGASGSNSSSASSAVPAGIPDHSNGGGTSAPSRAYCAGIAAPSENAGLLNSMVTGEELPERTQIVIEAYDAARDLLGNVLRDADGHLVPGALAPQVRDETYAAAARKAFKGKIVVGRDLQVL